MSRKSPLAPPPPQYQPSPESAEAQLTPVGVAADGGGQYKQRPESAENGKHRELAYPPAPEPLPYPVQDNHTHLDFRDGGLVISPSQAMDAAAAVNVSGAVQVGFDVDSSEFTIAALDSEPRLLGAVAIHPNDAAALADQRSDGQGRTSLDAAIDRIAELAEHPRVRAIGETGLDYFRTGPSGVADQQYSFRRHINIAKRLDLALQIHDRDAHEDVVRILMEEDAPERTVFHCFSGDAELARICNGRGWYMSFSGTVTFKNSTSLQEALMVARPELVLVETDAPFLTPHPFRGRPNASYLIPATVRFMAQHVGADLEQLCRQLAANTTEVYGRW